jgi:hypothetical protein
MGKKNTKSNSKTKKKSKHRKNTKAPSEPKQNIPHDTQMSLESSIKEFNDAYWNTMELSLKSDERDAFNEAVKLSIANHQLMADQITTATMLLKDDSVIANNLSTAVVTSSDAFKTVVEFLTNLEIVDGEPTDEQTVQLKEVTSTFHTAYQKMISYLLSVAPASQENVQKQVLEAEAQSDEKYAAMSVQLIEVAAKMWSILKKKIKDDPEFMEWTDTKKLDLFRDTLKFKDFMKEFPVMTRYLICMGQYSSKAFKRFLDKVRRSSPEGPQEKGVKEDNWIKRQADYVQYLWEAYQKGHYNMAERNYVWQDAYKNLRGEMDDFRDKFKAIEESTKEQKEQLKASNARDLIGRLASGNQTLPAEETMRLVTILKDKLYKRMFSNSLIQLINKVERVPAVISKRGTGPDMPDKPDNDKPTVRMTEHVVESRMAEIPEELVSTQPMFDDDGNPVMKRTTIPGFGEG